MKVATGACALLLLCGTVWAQEKMNAATGTRSVTVPVTVDHNRVLIDVELPLVDGSREQVHAWVDNGNPDLSLSRRLATLLGLAVACHDNDQECTGPAPREILIGGMAIPLAAAKEARIPLKPVSAAAMLAPGMNAEINIPASVLRQYDVLIDFPGRKFTIATPGIISFRGSNGRVQITANGLIQVPSQIENKKYNLALDVGSSISFLSDELFDKLAASHPGWPHMTGAVGSANMWGAAAETKWKVMRVDRVQFGPLFLTDVAMVSTPKTMIDYFVKRAGMPTAGLIGANVLQNYRVGLDYAHSMVHFEVARTYTFPDFDVVGLILRPEDNGGFTILGVADLDGKPSVPTGADGIQAGDHLVAVNEIPVAGSTLGQVWAMLGGTQGQARKLTIERAGKQFVVVANVQHFIGTLPDTKENRQRY
jgi:hypothetical protein